MDLQGNGRSYRIDNAGVSERTQEKIQDKGEVSNVVCTNGRSTNGRREEKRERSHQEVLGGRFYTQGNLYYLQNGRLSKL